MPKMLQTIIFQKPDKVSRALDDHIQIHFTNGHWVVSQLYEGTVNLYDSLNATTISANLSEQIQALYFKGAGSGSVSLIPVQKQPNVTDCGLYAKRQKLQLVATQRNEEIRAEFTSDVSIYEPHMLVFIDETGTDRRDALRKYGYSLRGKTPRSNRLLYRGQHLSALTIMSCDGILDVHIEHESVNGDTFF